MRRFRLVLAALTLVAVTIAAPAPVMAGGGPAPSETCVPGTIWEDLVSGVKYLCIYDELYGGTRWEPLSSGQEDDEGWMYRSSTYGCAFGTVGLTSLGGYGADTIVRGYRWPCRTAADRVNQPAGELRARVIIQRYSGGWSTCRDTGFRYSTVTTNGWLAGLDMGIAADCGTGSYRAWGFGAFYQGGAWRGGSRMTPSMPFR